METQFWTNAMSVVVRALLVLVVITFPLAEKYLTLAEFVTETILAAMHAKILVLIAPEDFWMRAAFAAETMNLAQGVTVLQSPRKLPRALV
jgi:hypothetical protein